MSTDPNKRLVRETKRTVKKLGGKLRRRELKKQLREQPEDAAHAEETFGRLRSDVFNGYDRKSRPAGE
jgi:hypothetical protein